MVSTTSAHASEPAALSRSCERLVEEYAYLCRRAARKFIRDGLERCDLEQVGAVGLIKAAKRYDAHAQTPFEAYAWIVIVGELMHHVRDYERVVRVPRRLHDLERPYLRAHDLLTARFGREPSDRELAEHLGTVVQAISELRAARAANVVVPIEDAARAECAREAALAVEDRIVVADAFSVLERVERRIIVGIYLLGLTQCELARRLTLSPKRVSRIHRTALRRMRAACA